MALPLVAPLFMQNLHRLSKRMHLLLWLLSKRPKVACVNLVLTLKEVQ